MARNILILGASYGSLLGTKLLMAGHNVTLVCRNKTAELINRDGTEVRNKLRDEPAHRKIFSRDLPVKLDSGLPRDVDGSRYGLVCFAIQEPQYTNHTVRVLMVKIAAAKLPCLSIMNMPPLPYLQRIPALAGMDLEEAYTNAQNRDWCRCARPIHRRSGRRKRPRMCCMSACRQISKPPSSLTSSTIRCCVSL